MTDSNNAQTSDVQSAAPSQVNDGVTSALPTPADASALSAAPAAPSADVAPEAAVAAQPEPTAPPAQPKTYFERLHDMESMIALFKGAIGELQTAYELVMSTLTEYVTEINTINATLGALIDLGEAGTQVTRSNIDTSIKSKIAERIKETLKKREEAGMISPIDAVTDSMNVISFSTKSDPFSFRLLKQLSEDLQKESVGKKVGDTLGDMTLLGIYKINKKDEAKAPDAAPAPASN